MKSSRHLEIDLKLQEKNLKNEKDNNKENSNKLIIKDYLSKNKKEDENSQSKINNEILSSRSNIILQNNLDEGKIIL